MRAEIRDQLAGQRARPIAEQKMRDAVAQVTQKVDKYGGQLSIAEAVGKDAEKPKAPNVSAMAKELNLTLGETPLWDALDITLIRQSEAIDDEPASYQLARATETVWSQVSQVRRSLADVAFGEQTRLYAPEEFVDGIRFVGGFNIPPDKLFAYWRIKEVKESVPEFKDVRDEVVRAWKLQQALPKAQAEAERMAKQVNEEGKAIAELFPGSSEKVIHTMLFSWMTRGSTPGGMGGQPMLSPVNGTANGQSVNVSGAGDEFMRAVFDLEIGQGGVAVNQAHTFAYVVRVVSEDQADEARRSAFYTAGLTPDVGVLVEEEQMRIIRDWLDSLEKDYNLKWEREPREEADRSM